MFSPQIKPGSVKYGAQGIGLQVINQKIDKTIWEDLGKVAEHSVAKKTWNTYSTAERMLAKFCKEKRKPLELPVNEETVLEFLHWLIFERSLSAASISGYLAGIKKLHVIKGLPEPNLRSNLVKMVLEGKKNMDAAAGRGGDHKRQVITPLIMKLLKARICKWEAAQGDRRMVWAVCSLLFHGAFRGAEMLSRNTACFDPAYTLLRRDICHVTDPAGKAEVQVRLKAPKECKTKSESIVDVYQTGSDLCPVKAVMKWLDATKGMESDLPAFRFVSGVPLTGQKLNKLLKEWLEDAAPGISTHSFRIGAASMMGKLGFSDKEVKAVGRWSSRAFESYIRLPRTKRKLVADKMAKYSC
jgi:hypothetical protein